MFAIVVFVIVIVYFYLLDTSHIYPQNKTIFDPCKMLLPFFPEKAATVHAKLVLFTATVTVALWTLLKNDYM